MWIIFIFFTLVFGVAGYFVMPTIYSYTRSSYSRTGIESICEVKFGNTSIMSALTKEIVIVSYDYASHQPRLFSKINAQIWPEIYNYSLAECAEASSAAPLYFDPKVLGNQTLVDGGIIANEPALYAFLHAKYAMNIHPD